MLLFVKAQKYEWEYELYKLCSQNTFLAQQHLDIASVFYILLQSLFF